MLRQPPAFCQQDGSKFHPLTSALIHCSYHTSLMLEEKCEENVYMWMLPCCWLVGCFCCCCCRLFVLLLLFAGLRIDVHDCMNGLSAKQSIWHTFSSGIIYNYLYGGISVIVMILNDLTQHQDRYTFLVFVLCGNQVILLHQDRSCPFHRTYRRPNASSSSCRKACTDWCAMGVAYPSARLRTSVCCGPPTV